MVVGCQRSLSSSPEGPGWEGSGQGLCVVGRRGRPHHDSRGLPEVLYRPLVQTWFIRKVVLSLMLLRRQETVGVSQGRFLYFVENSSVWGLHHLGWALFLFEKPQKERFVPDLGAWAFLLLCSSGAIRVQHSGRVPSACASPQLCPEPGLFARETHRTQKVGHLEDCGRDFTLASKMTRA